MLRKWTRYDIDDRPSDVWIADEHVVAVMPNGATTSRISTTGSGHFRVNGNIGEVAGIINGMDDPQ